MLSFLFGRTVPMSALTSQKKTKTLSGDAPGIQTCTKQRKRGCCKKWDPSCYDTFLIQDADLELSPADIPSMLEAMQILKVEFINGSRYLPGKLRPLSSFKRYWLNRIFTNLTAILINVKIMDVACGYKLFKQSLYEKISLKENRFGFEAELIIKALRIKKNNVAEVPVSYFPRNKGEGKKLRNSDGLKILKTLLLYGVLRLK